MNTEELYVASLRIVIYRKNFESDFQTRVNKHLKYVLVQSNDMIKFNDVKTGEYYQTGFRDENIGIDLLALMPFNEITGNPEKYIEKRKALTLFDKKVNEWRSKE